MKILLTTQTGFRQLDVAIDEWVIGKRDKGLLTNDKGLLTNDK